MSEIPGRVKEAAGDLTDNKDLQREGQTEQAGDKAKQGIDKAVDTYGRSERSKLRPVLYYLLVKHFGREAAYA